MERCGKRNASNSGSESWTGIGVVAGCGAVVLIMQWPYRRNNDGTWGSKLLQRLQEVRTNCKTRNQLSLVTVLIRCGLPLPVYFLADEKHTRCRTAKVYLPTIVCGRVLWHLGDTE